jgi:hypothetical protein
VTDIWWICMNLILVTLSLAQRPRVRT